MNTAKLLEIELKTDFTENNNRGGTNVPLFVGYNIFCSWRTSMSEFIQ